MRTKQTLIVIGIVLALLVIISLTSCTVMPYSPNNLFSKEYVYEGLNLHKRFKQVAPNISKTTNQQIVQNTAAVNKLKSKSNTSGTKQIGSTYSGALILKKKMNKPENLVKPVKPEIPENPVKPVNPEIPENPVKQGFRNMLVSEPYPMTDNKLDYFSQLSSGIKCELSPYSNSKGYICLDSKAIKLLKTRGGNMSDNQDSQIG